MFLSRLRVDFWNRLLCRMVLAPRDSQGERVRNTEVPSKRERERERNRCGRVTRTHAHTNTDTVHNSSRNLINRIRSWKGEPHHFNTLNDSTLPMPSDEWYYKALCTDLKYLVSLPFNLHISRYQCLTIMICKLCSLY